jgi:hypothetical protein
VGTWYEENHESRDPTRIAVACAALVLTDPGAAAAGDDTSTMRPGRRDDAAWPGPEHARLAKCAGKRKTKMTMRIETR